MKRPAVLLGVLVCGAIGVACAPASASPGAPTKIIAAQSQVTAGELPVWMAKQSGIFAKHGLDVDPEPIRNGSTTMAALASGEVQIATVGGSEALSAAASGADVVVLATLDHFSQYRLLVAPEIKSVADLKGQTLGTGSRGGTPDIALRAALIKMGLDPERDLALVSVPSPQARTAAILSGAIKGGLYHPPESLQLEQKGFHTLYDLAAQKIPAADGCIVVSRSYLSSHRAAVQAYVDAVVETSALMHRDEPATVSALEEFLGSKDEAAMKATYDFYVGEVLAGTMVPNPTQFKDIVAVLGPKNEALRTFDISKLLDGSLVQASEQRLAKGS